MKLEHETYVLVAETCQTVGAELCNVLAGNDNLAGIRLVQSADNLQESSLAGTTGTDDTHHLALAYLQVYALEHL